MNTSEWNFDYGKISKNIIEHEPVKYLFNELFESLVKNFLNTIEYDADNIPTETTERKMDQLLNNELINNYIQTKNLTEKRTNKLFVLFIDKVLTRFIKLKSTNPELYPKDQIEKFTTYLNKLNDIWKMKVRKKFEILKNEK